MTRDNSNEAITRARAVVLKWVCRLQSGSYSTTEELVQSFCSLLPAEVELELRSSYNPSALVFEARWYHQDRSPPFAGLVFVELPF